jgi:hypothetical protein
LKAEQTHESLEQLKNAAGLYAEGARVFPDYAGQHFRPQEEHYFRLRHWRCQAEIALRLSSDLNTYREAVAILRDDSFTPTDKSACATALKAIDSCLEAAQQDDSLDQPAQAALIADLKRQGDRIRTCDLLVPSGQ